MLVLLVACTTYRDIEQEGGWWGVALGSASSELVGARLVSEDGLGGAVYTRKERDRYGKARVGGVRYEFWDDRLFRIEVRTGNSKAFLEQLTQDFGTPSYKIPWQWGGQGVQMNFRGNEHDAAAVLILVDPARAAKVEQERRERRAAAAKADSEPLEEPESDREPRSEEHEAPSGAAGP
ncbi:MAG: hypothetical protein EA397_00840 [Deltaproteobacteria bacterium]|nr:MAG: hypothetical protein EA397_00840 [Deltaproteobacteria bacterium]